MNRRPKFKATFSSADFGSVPRKRGEAVAHRVGLLPASFIVSLLFLPPLYFCSILFLILSISSNSWHHLFSVRPSTILRRASRPHHFKLAYLLPLFFATPSETWSVMSAFRPVFCCPPFTPLHLKVGSKYPLFVAFLVAGSAVRC